MIPQTRFEATYVHNKHSDSCIFEQTERTRLVSLWKRTVKEKREITLFRPTTWWGRCHVLPPLVSQSSASSFGRGIMWDSFQSEQLTPLASSGWFTRNKIDPWREKTPTHDMEKSFSSHQWRSRSNAFGSRSSVVKAPEVPEANEFSFFIALSIVPSKKHFLCGVLAHTDSVPEQQPFPSD